jgi:predicted RNase H-like HicB family nuclease
MKYKIIVGKSNEDFYFAYCLQIPGIQVCGATAASAIDKLQAELLCCLHDSGAEFEIVVSGTETVASQDIADRPL